MISKSYPESVQESEKYLRMALQNISKNSLPYNPIAYALWYEYFIGRIDLLNSDIELVSESEKPISNTTVEKLFRKHIADRQFHRSAEPPRTG